MKSSQIFYLCGVIKQGIHIALLIFLSSLISLETVGLYITKDICEPCGNSTLEIALLKSIESEHQHNKNEHCCTTKTNKDHRSNSDNTCNHNAEDHKHHEENYYLRNEPVFIGKTNNQEITPQLLAVLLPFLKPYLLTKDHSFLPKKEIPLLFETKESYRSFLCTYLL